MAGFGEGGGGGGGGKSPQSPPPVSATASFNQKAYAFNSTGLSLNFHLATMSTAFFKSLQYVCVLPKCSLKGYNESAC